jgi:outer membrane protein
MFAYQRLPVFALLGLLALPSVLSGQGAGQPLTIDDAVRQALLRNPEILVAQAQLDELKGKITEVRSGAFPQIEMQGFGLRLRDPSVLNTASFDQLPPEFRSALVPRPANLFDAGVTLRQPIFTAGKIGTAVKLAVESQREREAALEAARQRVVFKVFQAFHDLLLAQENLLVVRETARQRQQHLEQARNRFSLGVATEVDVLRSQVNLANTRPELIRAENRLRMARSALNSLIVVDLDAPTVISGKLQYENWESPPAEELQRRAAEARPEVLVARRQVDEARLALSLAHAENKLSVDMESSFGISARDVKNLYQSDYARWNVRVNFKLPLYDSGRKAGLIVQAQARMSAAQHALSQLMNYVNLEIKAAQDDLQSSAQSVEAARVNVSQAEKVLSMMQANYQYGAATTLDVVDAEAALTMARNAVLMATYEFQLAKARLRLASGSPILDSGEVR